MASEFEGRMKENTVCDVLVIGAGAGGLAAAIAVKARGLDVLLIEKESQVGGTMARSGGGLWAPNNPVAKEAGVKDSHDSAREYIRLQCGNAFDSRLIEVYLRETARMLQFFQNNTSVKFIPTLAPDHHPELSGGASQGRALHTALFDGRELGAARDKIAPPMREQTFLSMQIDRAELPHFLKAGRSLRSALFVLGRLAAHFVEVQRYGRGMRLTNGNALAGRLLKSALDAGVRLSLSTRAVRLNVAQDAVKGAIVQTERRQQQAVIARRAVILASGGFTHDLRRQKELFSHVKAGQRHWSPVPAGNTGDGIRLGEQAGGQIAQGYSNPAYWLPVSIVPRRDNTFGVFPHLALDRYKPGYIAVARNGRRFVNEAINYHEFTEAMLRNAENCGEASAFLICDHRAIRRYGLGAARPYPLPLKPYLRSGYITKANSPAELAERLGIDARALSRTVEDYNLCARSGRDPEFGRGTTEFQQFQGDSTHLPNPCVGPLDRPPFYAVKLLPGDTGTFLGLKTDEHARVLDRDDCPIKGLYAVGNDMANIFGGFAPGGGISIGPAMTFGFLAAQHIAGAGQAQADGGRT
jgi:succinate dehydrogenase/fumarate reductase flavoprotein subunit